MPHIGESPTALECKLLNVIRKMPLEGKPIDNWVVIGQVVGAHIRSEFLKDGFFDIQAAQPILRGRCRGDYARIGAMFEMTRSES